MYIIILTALSLVQHAFLELWPRLLDGARRKEDQQGYTKISGDIREAAKICKNMRQYARIYRDVQECMRTCDHTRGHKRGPARSHILGCVSYTYTITNAMTEIRSLVRAIASLSCPFEC